VPAQGRAVFKSVGSALQDLALAVRYYELLGSSAAARVASLASLKRPVSAKRNSETGAARLDQRD
jgi:hypothetical protein